MAGLKLQAVSKSWDGKTQVIQPLKMCIRDRCTVKSLVRSLIYVSVFIHLAEYLLNRCHVIVVCCPYETVV